MPSSPAFIIVKYASADMRDFYYQKNYRFTQGDSAHLTFTARQVGLPMHPFSSREEAQPWLDKMIEFNPSAGYGIVEIED